jgi:DeoR family L-fucose operon activator
MTLALDASSTCFHLARQLPDIPLTVFTNSLPVCQEMARRQHINLICSGGRLERQNRCYVNPALVTMLKSLEVDLFIFSCEGWMPAERCGIQRNTTPPIKRIFCAGRASLCC